MPYWQREILREQASMALATTYKLDLPKQGHLSALFLQIWGDEATGYGQAGGDWTIADKISKIEVIGNGSTVIKSLTGKQVQALCTYDQGVMPPTVLRNYATNTQFDYFLLNFGRFLYDPDMYLDLERFDNVELWITNTMAAASFPTPYVKVIGFFGREMSTAGYLGYLRSEEWKQWATVQDETVYNELPTELLIRRIMLQAIPAVDADYVVNTTPENLMYDIKLALDTGALLVFDGSMKELMLENYLDFGKLLIRSGYNYNNADKGYDVELGYVIGGSVGIASHDGAVAGSHVTSVAVETKPTQHNENYQADKSAAFVFQGIAPYKTALFRFDYSYDPITWLDPNRRKTVKLDIHTRNAASAASGSNRIILDRVVR